MQPDKLAVLPKFRNKIAVLRVGLELHAVAYRLFGGIGSLIGHGLQRILLVPRTEKAAGQQQAQGESHCIRTDRPIPENRTDSLAAPWTKYGYEHDGIMNSGATDVKMIISTGRSVSPAQTGSPFPFPLWTFPGNRLRKKGNWSQPSVDKKDKAILPS